MNTPDTPNPKQGDTLKNLLDRNAGGRFSLRRVLPAVALIVIVVASLLLFAWGAFLKDFTALSLALTLTATACL